MRHGELMLLHPAMVSAQVQRPGSHSKCVGSPGEGADMATVSLLRLPVKQLSNIDPDVLSPVFQSHPLRGAVEACDLTASFPVPHGLQPVRLPLLVCHPASVTLARHGNH